MSIQEQYRAAQHALSQFAIEPANVRLYSHSENLVFRVDTHDSRTYVLRLHRPAYHNLVELESEQLWTEALLAEGVDVPVALPTRTGNRYASTEIGSEHRFAGLLEWVEGEQLSAQSLQGNSPKNVEIAYRNLGSVMAQLHEHATGWRLPPGFRRHAFDAAGLAGEAPFWGRFWQAKALSPKQQAHLRELRGVVSTRLQEMPKSPKNYSLIHADLHTANVIVNDRRLHVIDFDDTGFGWHAYDFAIALQDHEDARDFHFKQSSLLDGYATVRSVDEDTVKNIRFFQLVRVLASIGWIDNRPELQRDGYSEHLYRQVLTQASVVL